MAKYDFEVDIESLINAAKGVAKAVEEKKDEDVSDDCPDKEDVSNSIVSEAISEFSERWERGINDMVGDSEEVSGRLGKVAMNYLEYNEAVERRMKKVRKIMGRLPKSSEGRQ